MHKDFTGCILVFHELCKCYMYIEREILLKCLKLSPLQGLMFYEKYYTQSYYFMMGSWFVYMSFNVCNCTVPQRSGFVLLSHSTGKHIPSLTNLAFSLCLYFSSLSFLPFQRKIGIIYKLKLSWFSFPPSPFSCFYLSYFSNISP